MAKQRIYQISGDQPLPGLLEITAIAEFIAPENCYRRVSGTMTVTSPDEATDEDALTAARQSLLDAGWLSIEVQEVTND
jgi:hypothetical protein